MSCEKKYISQDQKKTAKHHIDQKKNIERDENYKQKEINVVNGIRISSVKKKLKKLKQNSTIKKSRINIQIKKT